MDIGAALVPLPARYHADGMLDRVAEFVARHRMFDQGTPEPGQRAGVAVSGGADSVFLLHALRELAPCWNLRLSVIHVEHGIRGAASLADAEFVAQLSSTFGLPFHIRRADVPALDGNLEQAARNVRQAFYAELIAARAVDRVATGHTRTDQAETALYRILRGSGLTGLAGILPTTREGLIRPLLEIDRGEIEAWLRERGIAWREDETNRDRTFARNRLRHEILPLLRDAFNPQLDQALGNLATLARDEEAYWESELAGLRQHPTTDTPRSAEGHDRMQAPGLDVCRAFDWIRIARAATEAPAARDFSVPLQIPGSVELPGASARTVLQVLEKDNSAQPRVEAPGAKVPCAKVIDELDWQRFYRGEGAPSLELRNWRPGDQYRRVGQSKAEKVKFFFQEARVPLWERRNWPIIAYAGKIVWARRFGAAAEFASGPETRSVLQVSEIG